MIETKIKLILLKKEIFSKKKLKKLLEKILLQQL